MAFKKRALAQAIAQIQVVPDQIVLTGGLDLVTPPMQLKPGFARVAQNYEASQYGGYRRIPGYERFDGRAKPSAASYSILNVTITGAFAAGNTITGVTSGATAVVIAVVTTGTAYLAITKVVGTFQNGETLNVAAAPQGTVAALAVTEGASTVQLHAQYKNLAADQYRNDIGAVPGSGAILGTWLYNDVVYAFRNNVGATAAAMYKSTAGGWSLVAFEFEVSFTAGSGAATIVDGGTLTQGGVTATIRRVLVRSGSLAGGTAAGTMVISAPSGGNFGAGAATVGAGTLTLAGIQTAITQLPGGRYEFISTNFGGSVTTKRMYGVDGVNRCFEFDGSYFVPISTGMTVDAPKHITEHKKHLFLAFGGSAQHSGPGTPYVWSPVLGAAELALGDTITAFKVQPGSEGGGALAIFTRNRLSILYGSSSADWVLTPYRDELGAFAYTVQDVGYSMFLDDRGITDLQTAQTFGNFAHATISDRIRPLINEYRTIATATCVCRDNGQYRIFFSNRSGFYVTLLGRKVVGIMPVLYQDVVRNVVSEEMNDGSEAMFFGSDDGWVFQMDMGTSMDGDSIEAFLELAFNFQGSPQLLKTYREILAEVTGLSYAEYVFGYTLGYGSTDVEQPAATAIDFSAARWDSFTWDAFTWDGRTLIPNALRVDGTANNISLAFRSNNDYFQPFTHTGIVLNYTPRRRLH